MSRLISCHWCGRFHSSNEICNKKPKVDYKQKRENLSEINKRENEFYSSSRWQRFRDSIMKDRMYRCEICNKAYEDRRKYSQAKELHHIEYLRDSFDKRLDEDNVICLCAFHHKDVHRNNIRNKDDLENYIEKMRKLAI